MYFHSTLYARIATASDVPEVWSFDASERTSSSLPTSFRTSDTSCRAEPTTPLCTHASTFSDPHDSLSVPCLLFGFPTQSQGKLHRDPRGIEMLAILPRQPAGFLKIYEACCGLSAWPARAICWCTGGLSKTQFCSGGRGLIVLSMYCVECYLVAGPCHANPSVLFIAQLRVVTAAFASGIRILKPYPVVRLLAFH